MCFSRIANRLFDCFRMNSISFSDMAAQDTGSYDLDLPSLNFSEALLEPAPVTLFSGPFAQHAIMTESLSGAVETWNQLMDTNGWSGCKIDISSAIEVAEEDSKDLAVFLQRVSGTAEFRACGKALAMKIQAIFVAFSEQSELRTRLNFIACTYLADCYDSISEGIIEMQVMLELHQIKKLDYPTKLKEVAKKFYSDHLLRRIADKKIVDLKEEYAEQKKEFKEPIETLLAFQTGLIKSKLAKEFSIKLPYELSTIESGNFSGVTKQDVVEAVKSIHQGVENDKQLAEFVSTSPYFEFWRSSFDTLHAEERKKNLDDPFNQKLEALEARAQSGQTDLGKSDKSGKEHEMPPESTGPISEAKYLESLDLLKMEYEKALIDWYSAGFLKLIGSSN